MINIGTLRIVDIPDLTLGLLCFISLLLMVCVDFVINL